MLQTIQHEERREGCIYLWLPVTCFSIGNARKEINTNRTEEDAREKEGYSTLLIRKGKQKYIASGESQKRCTMLVTTEYLIHVNML